MSFCIVQRVLITVGGVLPPTNVTRAILDTFSLPQLCVLVSYFYGFIFVFNSQTHC